VYMGSLRPCAVPGGVPWSQYILRTDVTLNAHGGLEPSPEYCFAEPTDWDSGMLMEGRPKTYGPEYETTDWVAKMPLV
jgi:hypothetical protein